MAGVLECTVSVTGVNFRTKFTEVDGTTQHEGKKKIIHVAFGSLDDDMAYKKRILSLSPGQMIKVRGQIAERAVGDGHLYGNVFSKANLL